MRAPQRPFANSTTICMRLNSGMNRSTVQFAAGEAGFGNFLLLGWPEWIQVLIGGVLCTLLTAPWYRDVSLWIAPVVFLMAGTIVHLRYASRFVPPFPHIAILMALLQYVLAAWFLRKYSPVGFRTDMGERLPVYLSYAGPVLVAVGIGWSVGFYKLRPAKPSGFTPTRELLRSLDGLIVVGFASLLIARLFPRPALAFILALVSNLRYVGVCGRMLYRGSGWRWRLVIVMGVEVVLASEAAMFHTLILWFLWICIFWIHTSKPSWTLVSGVLVGGLLLLPALQESKWELRRSVLSVDVQQSMGGKLKLAFAWLSYMEDGLVKTATGDLEPDFVEEMVERYNQGWIINKVMEQVPELEPFAHGKTLESAAVACVLPRFLAPNKVTAGGRENVARYAGIILNEDTSANLGFAGEMYANFGYWGGIIGAGLYALAYALLFRAICVRAFVTPLWWGVLAFLCFPALKAEEGLAEVLNYTAKACVVLALVCLCSPSIRRALFPPSSGSQKLGPIRRRGLDREPRRQGPCFEPRFAGRAADRFRRRIL
jgi:hypothetical protein